jgi:hypothetical protein
MRTIDTLYQKLNILNVMTVPFLSACGAGALGVAALVSSFFGGSFSAALPVIGPFAVANRAPDVPRMVVFPFHSDIQAAAISKDNTTMFIADRFNNVVRVIDLETKEQKHQITVGTQLAVNYVNSTIPDGVVFAGIRPTNIMISPLENDFRAFVTGQSSDEEAVRTLNPGSNFPEKHSVANTLTIIDTKTVEVIRNVCCGCGTSGNGYHAGWEEGLRGQCRNRCGNGRTHTK